MRLRLFLLPLLLLLTAGRVETDARTVASLRKLAAEATTAGFHSLARRCARDASRLSDKAAVEAKSDDDAPKLSGRKRQKLLAGYRKVRERAAADLAKLAGEAEGKERAALAEEAIRLDREFRKFLRSL